MDFLKFECLHEGNTEDRYFFSVMLWSFVPMGLAGGILLVALFRLKLADNLDDSSAVKATVVNQHVWAGLLLTYLVLPPVG